MITHRHAPALDGQTSATGRALSTRREDLGAALLGLWLVIAVFLDGRAHWLGLPDSFFTPWHGLLYGGLLALGAWLLAMGWRRRGTVSGRRTVFNPPPGFGWPLTGAGIFAAGGVADLAWHQVFGIEAGIDALLSPSHLMLFVGAGFLLSGPVLAAREKGTGASTLPVTLAVLALSAVAAFALSFLSGFFTDAATYAVGHFPEGTPAHIAAETRAEAGLGSYVVTSVVLVVPLAYLVRNWRIPFGVVAGYVTAHAALASTLVNFGFTGARIVLAAAVAGVLADIVLSGARRAGISARAQSLVTAALVPVLLWSSVLSTVQLTYGVQWSAELVGGVVVVSALLALLVVLLSQNGRNQAAR
ncbi:hypothetical protein [Amycolatopsis saalfeldensis]|uniref:Uncharacterized protein n=1 Tax=Amycolatopsis saalfeldensis TaxID=394193 RepID=A0A1H8YMX8_9PSEU|nr:hypothetical protein [Amycolatopsis saalfeldensis]SEP53545.1 hypothetical protein SAMN04489732_12832 [Amycolatopsis saalfeldensis]